MAASWEMPLNLCSGLNWSVSKGLLRCHNSLLFSTKYNQIMALYGADIAPHDCFNSSIMPVTRSDWHQVIDKQSGAPLGLCMKHLPRRNSSSHQPYNIWTSSWYFSWVFFHCAWSQMTEPSHVKILTWDFRIKHEDLVSEVSIFQYWSTHNSGPYVCNYSIILIIYLINIIYS